MRYYELQKHIVEDKRIKRISLEPSLFYPCVNYKKKSKIIKPSPKQNPEESPDYDPWAEIKKERGWA